MRDMNGSDTGSGHKKILDKFPVIGYIIEYITKR